MGWGSEIAQAPPSTTGTISVPVVFALGGESIALEIEAVATATAGDLIDALADGQTDDRTVLAVDDRLIDRDSPLDASGIRAGSRLDLRPSRRCQEAQRPGLSPVTAVRVVGGLDAGRILPVTEGRHLLGRAEDADVRLPSPTVSARHAVIDVTATGRVTITDASSTNGTRVDAVFAAEPTHVEEGATVDLGATQIRFAPAWGPGLAAMRRPGPFNRPPRATVPHVEEPLTPPAAPSTAIAHSRFSWTAIVLPLLTGAVLAFVWDPRMAAFALFSPVFVVGNWLEDRRRARRNGRANRKQLARDLDQFRDAVRLAAQRERERREVTAPDPAELSLVVTGNDARLWQRRPDHNDAFIVRVGVGSEPFRPPLRDERTMADEAAAVVREGRVERGPVLVDIAPGNVLGVVSADHGAAASVARSVVMQTAVHVGPADLRIAVFTDRDRVDHWGGAPWLPHNAGTGEAAGTRLLSGSPTDVAVVVNALAVMSDVARLVVVDAPGLTTGRPAPVRTLLAGGFGPVLGIVVANAVDELPASCTHVVEVDSDGAARLTEPATGRIVDDLVATGIDATVAESLAHTLAATDDPEAGDGGRSLPTTVHALDLLGLMPTPEGIAECWRSHERQDAGLPAMLGLTDDGPLVVDLVSDGPHALLGGTTGAGKSELLRTLVATLAASVGPERLNIVLIDYKGGSAFDACSRLPHTVGVVTDLDDHLGQRALRCLEAELRHREGVLRAAGAIDLVHHHSLCPDAPLPRLLVVIDEFATMAAELPDFIDSLVGIAQRGRSLGVHLVLATQRPAGAVKDNIRANTNLRIALRVQDATDSNDVLGSPDAAAISRRHPGRGFTRLGPTELVPFQAALISGRSASNPAPIQVRPLAFGPRPADGNHPRGAATDTEVPTDLDRLVDASIAAADALGVAPPRRPWPDPLPARVSLSDLPAGAIGLADDPARQCQLPYRWTPADGNLLLFGAPGSGTTTALDTIAIALARTTAPADLHLYALDFGAGRLGHLIDLPHTGAIVGPTETERQRRLVRVVRSELDRRRTAGGGTRTPAARIVLLVDGWSAFVAAFDDVDGMDVRDQLARIVADGPAVGISTIITADNPMVVPTSLSSIVPTKLVLRLAERHDWSAFGIAARDVPSDVPGRGIDTRSRLEVQVARVDDATRASVRTGARTAAPIAVLPRTVALDDVAGSEWDGERWRLMFGLADTTLSSAGFTFHAADHATITGPTRSGRSTALLALARAATSSRPDAVITAIALRPSPLRDPSAIGATAMIRVVTNAADATAALEAASADQSPQLILVDDAEAFDDPSGAMATLLRCMRPDVHVVAAGRVDAIRAGYGHWTRELRRSRLGLALAPQPEDGEIFAATFPRRHLPAPVPGRGLVVVDGAAEILQVGVR